jgi:hypothetical protein
MDDGAEGVNGGRTVEVEAGRLEAVVGTDGGGSHGGWRNRCRRGEGSRHRRSGEGSCRRCRGSRRTRPRVLTSDVLASGILVSSPVSCTPSARRPCVRRPRVVAGEMYSQLLESSRRRPRILAVVDLLALICMKKEKVRMR